MPGIPEGRLMTGMYEALASMRAGGSGGGNGARSLAIAGSVSSIGPVSGITATGTATVVAGSTVTFQVSRPEAVLVIGMLNAGSNCAAGIFNLVALNGDNGLVFPDAAAWPSAMLLGIGVGTVNYLPFTLFGVLLAQPGQHTVNWQVNPNTTGSVTVNSGNLYVFHTDQ